jgi:UDP-2-acetamido-2,6-beta-L-arabino-hexul-4-ose reductase
MRILVTGSRGFIGKNLVLALNTSGHDTIELHSDSTPEDLRIGLLEAEAVVHLAGINRPTNPDEFHIGNVEFTERLLSEVAKCNASLPTIFASSIQAELENDYGKSKRKAEECFLRHATKHRSSSLIFRLCNVFGKWCRPNYNSVVATFCHNLTHGLPLQVVDATRQLSLVYIDDVVEAIKGAILNPMPDARYGTIDPVYTITVGELRDVLSEFWSRRPALSIGEVGTGLQRALYSTLISYAPTGAFAYPLTPHVDARGRFSEFLRSSSSGQVSFFTASPGITRGGHYHHTKLEKFLVVQGSARFRLRHVVSNEVVELFASGHQPKVVEPPPGWAHDVTNIGDNELIVLLWANEVFDSSRPDTFTFNLDKQCP